MRPFVPRSDRPAYLESDPFQTRFCCAGWHDNEEGRVSYVIQIWEQPADVALPANPKAVWPMLDQLLKRSPGLNPKYIELARQLKPGELPSRAKVAPWQGGGWTYGAVPPELN